MTFRSEIKPYPCDLSLPWLVQRGLCSDPSVGTALVLLVFPLFAQLCPIIPVLQARIAYPAGLQVFSPSPKKGIKQYESLASTITLL